MKSCEFFCLQIKTMWSFKILLLLLLSLLLLLLLLLSSSLSLLFLLLFLSRDSDRNVRWPSDDVIMWDHVTNSKLNISSSARPLTTQHDRLVTYCLKNLHMDSYDPVEKWWCVVTWQVKSLTYPLCKTYGYETWQIDGLWWGKRTHQVTSRFDHLVT